MIFKTLEYHSRTSLLAKKALFGIRLRGWGFGRDDGFRLASGRGGSGGTGLGRCSLGSATTAADAAAAAGSASSSAGLGAFQWHHTSLGPPDFVCVLLDGAVTGELADIGDVMDDHLHPLPAVSVCLGHLILTLDIGFIISEQAIPEGEWQVNTSVTCVTRMHMQRTCDDTCYIPVVVEQLVGEVVELVWFVGREFSGVDLVNGLLQLRNRLVIIPRYIPIF